MNIRGIAKIANCSPATVSRVLSGNDGNVAISAKTREKIVKICKENNYEPNIHASRMFSKRTGIIGLVTSDTRLEDGNLSKFMSGVNKAVNEAGDRLLLLLQNDKFISTKEYLTIFRRREVDAIIIWGTYGDSAWMNELAKDNHPFILASNGNENHPSVLCDESAGMKAMVQHCLDQGVERFAFVSGGRFEISEHRKDGFISAVGDHPYSIIEGDFTPESGKNAIKQLMPDLPGAVICVNDLTAIGAITALKEAGVSVPGEILVTGADNIKTADYLDPTITTYDQMAFNCGTLCVEALIGHLANDTPLASTLVTPEIHIRTSA